MSDSDLPLGSSIPDPARRVTPGDRDSSSGLPPVPYASASFLTRVGRLFTAPRAAFLPPLAHSIWITAFAILAISQIGQSVLLRDLGMAKARASIEENQKIPDEQKQKILEQMDAGTRSPAMIAVQTVVGSLVALCLGFLLPALLYWWGMTFLLAARSRFVDVLSVAGLSAMILVLRDLIRVPLMLSKGTLDVYTSPAALLTGGNPVLVQVLNRFDIFDLYRLFLLIVGLSAISGKPAGRTAVPVLAVWVLAFILMLGCALSPLGAYMR